jgi:Fe-S-cluster containining protein
MGKKTVRFRCHSCLHCCTDLVVLPTPFDVTRIVRGTGQEPETFLDFITPDDIDGVDDDDPTWLECGPEPGDNRYLMALKRDPKRGCTFLDRRRRKCGIYEHRPVICRLFPFKLQETREGEFRGFTLHQDVGCPRHKDGVVDTAPLYKTYLEDTRHQEDYEDLVKVFNRRRYAGKKPQDFIRMFYLKTGRRAAGEERTGTNR